ncbi:hypothetical protein VTI74DRAFT_7990 [Chaetomium olivicolor]
MPARPHPNDTKSMTVDEKVALFFPSPPSAKALKRRSSVPEVPRIPASYRNTDSSLSGADDRHHSNRTTKTTIRTESVLEVDEIPRLPGEAMVNIADEAGSAWLRAFGDEGGKSNNRPVIHSSAKRGSSPIIPAIPVRASAWTETTDERSEDENWSAMPSPEVAVSVPVVQRLGLPPSIRMLAPQAQDVRGSQLSVMDNRSRETLPIMLDTSSEDQADFQAPTHSETEASAVASPQLPTWHRRVGDECPTFSDRKEKSRSRKMSPPPPLSLHTTTTKKMIAVQVEPCPLESPGQAIRQIQAQLKKLEDLERASPQSASQRLALLEDLEREMGQQVEHWREIKHDMGRDSLSSMQTTSPLAQLSRRESVASTINAARNLTLRQSIGTERRASRIARIQSNGNSRIPETSVRNSGSPQLSKWQKRLTEVQMDYMDAQLLRKSSAHFLQLSRVQLASPTPPDSNPTSEDEVLPVPDFLESVTAEHPSETHVKSVGLWTPVSKERGALTGLLWIPTPNLAPEVEAPLPGLSVRPATRKELAPLRIESSQLWRKPRNIATRATSGLWRPLWASAAPPAEPLVRAPSTKTLQKPPRPVSQRPPRRNRRVTLLPDIIESPEPLPDRRGTLGIFQFPWGEKSDTASTQAWTSMYMAMPGTMTTGGPSLGAAVEARSKQLEPAEYSSSFFDDYDDEDENDEIDSDEERSDDGFDDSTLWEIASLLKTDAVPSRDSMFLQGSGSAVDDYIDEPASDEEGQNREQSIAIGLATSREQQRDSATLESSTLAMLEEAFDPETPELDPIAKLRFPVDPKPALDHNEIARASGSTVPTPIPEVSRMRGLAAEVHKAETTHETTHEQGSAGLWYPPSQGDAKVFSARKGLFVAEASRPESRGTAEEPAAKYISRRPRPVEQKPLGTLTSSQLWKPEDVVKHSERNWIFGTKGKHQGARNGAVSHRQRPRASEQDWKAALDEAIAASYPTKKLNRIAASPADWEAALQEAIALSGHRSGTNPAFDSSVRHPVFAARSLVTQSEWFHPAATGYTYDVAVVHPVFFGSLAITYPEEAVHPAIPAYAAAKLRRQRSKQTRSESGSRSTSRSRRKGEIRAQTHALEQEDRKADEVYTSSESTPPLPQPVSASRQDAIQAQIEALEQERLFAQRAALEEYRRRTTAMTMGEPVVEPMPAGAETVQDLQRRLSQRIRESLAFSTPSAKPVSPPAPTPISIVSSSQTASPSSPSTTTSSSTAATAPEHSATSDPKPRARLWTPPLRPPPIVSPTGLWTPGATSHTSPHYMPSAKEDAEAAAQRARRRKATQERERTQEVLGQIARMEGMWVRGEDGNKTGWLGEEKGKKRGWGRDWSGMFCVRRTRGVVLIY